MSSSAAPLGIVVVGVGIFVVFLFLKKMKKSKNYKKPVAIDRSVVPKSTSRDASKGGSLNETALTSPAKRGSAPSFGVD